MAMFGPSFFTGALIARFGKESIVTTGLFMLVACAVVALSGIALWQFWTSLILLGLGWNSPSSAQPRWSPEPIAPSEKGKVQGLHDFILFGTRRLRLADGRRGLQCLGLGNAELDRVPGDRAVPCRGARRIGDLGQTQSGALGRS